MTREKINSSINSVMKIFLRLFLIFLVPVSLYAGTEEKFSVASGTQLTVNKKLSVKDGWYNYMLQNPTTWPTRFTNSDPEISVFLRYPEQLLYLSPTEWSFTVNYTIELYDLNNNIVQTHTAQEVKINYFPQEGLKMQDIDIKKYPGFHRAKLTVTGVTYKKCDFLGTCLPGALPTGLNDIRLELHQRTNRNYILNETEIPVIDQSNAFKIGTGYPYTSFATPPPGDELELSWAFVEGAESYDLEWVFVDLPDMGIFQTEFISTDEPFDMANATRINTSFNHFKIPLAYPRGTILYRVRSVGVDPNDPELSVYSNWSFQSNTGTLLHTYNLSTIRFDYIGLEPGRNWSHSIAFAEEGKAMQAISYFDGTFRGRQSMTKINSDENLLVGENIYDFEGRQAVQLLPVPVTYNNLHFKSNFNDPLITTTFDIDTKYNNSDPLGTSTGTGKYYSPNSTGNEYIPDAEGYPYTITKFTNDGTGRVRSTSGIGEDYKIGSGHETKFYYGTPTDQRELDRLFGSEVGYLKHYRKVLTVDPNGQVNIAYIDQEGRTIATALAGDTPTNLLPIYDDQQPWPEVTADLLSGKNELTSSGEVISNATLLVPSNNILYSFAYNLVGDTYCDDCYIPCENCNYDLEISIRDEFGTSIPITITANNATCTTGNPIKCTNITATTGNITFTALLNLGSYSVNKVLILNENHADDLYGDFIQYQLDHPEGCFPPPVVAPESCDMNCFSLCQEQYVIRDLQGSIIGYEDEEGNILNLNDQADMDTYNDLITACSTNCPSTPIWFPSECEIRKKMMVDDMSPLGQYFDNIPTSTITETDGNIIPNPSYDINGWLEDPVRHPAILNSFLSDIRGSSCLPICPVPNCDIQTYPFTWSELREQWQDCWGEIALKYHPEYCIYYNHCISLSCRDNENVNIDMSESDIFDQTMQTVDDATGEIDYMNPFGIPPFIVSNPTNDASFGNSAYINAAPNNDDPFVEITCTETIEDCSLTNHELVLEMMRHYLPIDNIGSGYFSIWYLLEDPHDFHTTQPSALDPAVLQMFLNLHGDPNNNIPGILGTSPGQISKYRYFLSAYQFAKQYALFLQDKNEECAGFSDYDPETGKLPGGFIARYPYNSLFDELSQVTALGCSTPLNTAEAAVIISNLAATDFEDGCEATCVESASVWMQQLNSCSFTSQELTNIENYLIEICQINCSGETPEGTSGCSTCPFVLGPNNEEFYTFDDVIEYFSSNSCDIHIIHPQLTSDAICACQNLEQLIIDYLPSIYSASEVAQLANDFAEPAPASPYNASDANYWLNECSFDNPDIVVLNNNNFPDFLSCDLPGQLTQDDLEESALQSCLADNQTEATYASWFLYNNVLQAAAENFRRNYKDNCMNDAPQRETFNVTYQVKEYHYTLFYYDQAGNLTKTVPPQGVKFLDPVFYANCDAFRAMHDAVNFKVPDHSFISDYQFNSFQLVEEQKMPDAGTMKYFYDALGRIVVSQNARQNGSYGNGSVYSYTRYDELGRPFEAGELIKSTGTASMDDEISRDQVNFNATGNDLFDWMNDVTNDYRQVTQTFYDDTYSTTVSNYFGVNGQENLRNRVTSALYFENGISNQYDRASHYSYDIHGNVKTLIQEQAELTDIGQSLKRMDYKYDLISGNVHEVKFQEGKFDEFYHRYIYDNDNRLTVVYTSRDGYIWEKDEKFFYYEHGPMQRSEKGDKQVQGCDYVYTIHGWMKALNAGTLNASRDVGTDALPSGQHRYMSADAQGYVMHYFSGDYSPTGGSNFTSFSPTIANNSALGAEKYDLFNGNIPLITNALTDVAQQPVTEHGNLYQYDQLQRIRNSKVFTSLDRTQNQWLAIDNTNGKYSTAYSYDANGNIISLDRNGHLSGTLNMDNLHYFYYTSGPQVYDPAVNIPADATNKLAYVTDVAAAGNYTTDIDNQTATNNYQYDESGQLTADAGECIETIEWHPNGKVKKIIRINLCQLSGAAPNTYPADLEYQYDALGHRSVKIVKPRDNAGNLLPQSGWIYTYYILDAQGNTMAVYERTFTAGTQPNEFNDIFSLKESYIYGNNRMGMVNQLDQYNLTFTATLPSTPDLNGERLFNIITPPVAPNTDAIHDNNGIFFYTRTLGEKSYELTDHLGNVTEVISDKHLPIESEGYVFEDYENESITTAGNVHIPGTWFMGAGVSYSFVDDGFGNTRLKINETVQNAGAHRSFTAIPGSTYTATFNIEFDANTQIEALATADNVGGIFDGTALVNGNNTFTFTVPSTPGITTVRIKFNGFPMPNEFYLDNLSVTGLGIMENVTASYIADVTNFSDYYPGGMQKPDRFATQVPYRYAAQGQEKESEITGNNSHYSAEYWMNDTRTLRRWNTDPVPQTDVSSYAVFDNNPVINVDPNGDNPNEYRFDVGTNRLTKVSNEGGIEFQIIRFVYTKENGDIMSIGMKSYEGWRLFFGPVRTGLATYNPNTGMSENAPISYAISRTNFWDFAAGHNQYSNYNYTASELKERQWLLHSPDSYSGYGTAINRFERAGLARPILAYEYWNFFGTYEGQLRSMRQFSEIAGTIAGLGTGGGRINMPSSKFNYSPGTRTTLYRSVSQDELDDIAAFGVRNRGGYERGKLFTTSPQNAANFGRINYGLGDPPFTIIKTSISKRYSSSLYRGEMDLMPGILVPKNLFNKLSKPTPLNYSPTPIHPAIR